MALAAYLAVNALGIYVYCRYFRYHKPAYQQQSENQQASENDQSPERPGRRNKQLKAIETDDDVNENFNQTVLSLQWKLEA